MTRLLTRLTSLASVAAFCGMAAGCGSSTESSSGQLTMMLTDKAFSFDSVQSANIFVVRIDGKNAATDSGDAQTSVDDDTNGGNTDPSRGWVTLATPNQVMNLLALQNGTTTNLGVATLPTGSYLGFRLIIDASKSNIVLKNGTTLTGTSNPGIKFPSAARTGVKIVLDSAFHITSGGTVMVLDFDLGSSFVMRGNTISQNGLLFKPVIRAVARDITGTITGTVRATSATGALVAGATVQAMVNGSLVGDTATADIIRTTQTDANGNYTLAFMLPGTYAVRAVPPSTSTNQSAIVQGVVVTTGQTTSGVNLILP